MFPTSPEAVMELIRRSTNMNISGSEKDLHASGIPWNHSPLHTPLARACDELDPANPGNVEIIGLLLGHGADPDGLGAKGMNPLHLAAEKGRCAWIEMLIHAGADVNGIQWDNDTALICAAKNAHAEAVRMLLASGADSSIRGRGGRTAAKNAAKIMARNPEKEGQYKQVIALLDR
jgi:ankyrin repeat protein